MKNKLFNIVFIILLAFVYGCYKAPPQVPYRVNELSNLILQANKEFERGNLTTAQSLYQEALKKSRIIQDDNATVIILISLSRLCTKINQIQEAKILLSKAYQLSLRTSLPENILNELDFENARTGFLTNNLENAEVLLNKLINSDDLKMKIKSLNLLARIKIREYEYEKALNLLNESLRINKEVSKIEEANSYRLLGEIYSEKNKEIAEAYFLKALSIDKALAVPEKIAIDMQCLGEFYKKTGNIEKAEEYFLRAKEILSNLK